MIAAIVILLPAILHAQQGAPEAIAPLPGIGWQGPPGEVEWEPVEQAGPTDGRSQDHATAREQHDEAAKRRLCQTLAKIIGNSRESKDRHRCYRGRRVYPFIRSGFTVRRYPTTRRMKTRL